MIDRLLEHKAFIDTVVQQAFSTRPGTPAAADSTLNFGYARSDGFAAGFARRSKIADRRFYDAALALHGFHQKTGVALRCQRPAQSVKVAEWDIVEALYGRAKRFLVFFFVGG